MNVHRKVQQAIAVNKSKITSKQFFTSSILKKHFEDIAFGVTKKYGKERIMLTLAYDDKNSKVAYTTGKSIFINAGNNLLGGANRDNRYKYVYGLFAHEIGHILYTDFMLSERTTRAILQGSFYPELPKEKEYENDVLQITDYIQDRMKAQIVSRMYHKLQNVLEDGHIENRIMYNYQGDIKRNLTLLRNMHFDKMPTVSESEIKETEEGEYILSSVLQALLCYVKYGKLKYGEADISNERIQAVFSVANETDEYLITADTLKRAKLCNLIFVKLWKYFKPVIDALAEQSADERQYPNLMGLSDDGSGGQPMDSSSDNSVGDTRNTTQIKQLISQMQQGGSSTESENDSQTDNEVSLTQSSLSENEQSQEQQSQADENSSPDEETKNVGNEDTTSAEENGSSNGSESEETEEHEDSQSEDENGNSNESKISDDEADNENPEGNSNGNTDFDEESEETQSENDGEERLNENEEETSDSNGSDSEETEEQEECLSEDEDRDSDESNESQSESSEENNSEKEEEDSAENQSDNSNQLGKSSQQNDTDNSSNSENHDFEVPDEAKDAEGNGEITEDKGYESDLNLISAKTVDELMEEMATTKALNDYEKDLKKEVKQVVADLSLPNIHKSCDIELHRKLNVDETHKVIYDTISPELISLSKGLQRNVKQKLKDYQQGAKFTGLYFGRRIDKNNLSRTDGKIFYNNRLPQDVPQLAVGILIDESGSMSGTRIQSARSMAVVLYDFCRGLNIPVNIVGHTEEGWSSRKVELYDYCEFDSIDGNDKYRLMDIKDRGCNRDGAAIFFMCERLSKRYEEQKLLFVISDGLPNGDGYGGTSAKEDIATIVKRYERQGVKTIACAIGDDKKNIKEIYGENRFFDISDLSQLPNTLTKKIISTIKV